MFLVKIVVLANFGGLTFLSAKNIQIITSLPYSLGLANDIVLTGAAFDLAAERVNRKYDGFLNVRVKHLFNASHRTCDEVASQSAQMISRYYYNEPSRMDTCFAIATSPCNDDTGISSLTKEFDWLLFSNTLSKNDFLEPKDSATSTAVATGGTYRGYVRIMLEILDYFKWYHAAILVETKTIVPFYKNVGNLLLEQSRQSLLPFSLELYMTDVSSNETVKTVMGLAKQKSRVMILLTTGSTAARILKMAEQMEVANGEYVFINLQALQGDAYGKVSQFTLNNINLNETNINAFRSLFFITYRPVTDEVQELSAAIAERSKSLYNTTYKDGNEPLDSFCVQTSYDIVELFATVVNESENDEENLKLRCSGLRLAKRIANRTFDLSTGRMWVNAGRARNLDVTIFGFNISTMALQPIGMYEWAKRHLVWNENVSVDWPTIDNQPPKDIPLCGFSGNDGLCAAQAILSIVTIVVPVIIACLLLSGLAFLIRWQNLNKSACDYDEWRLDDKELFSACTRNQADSENEINNE